MTPYRKIESRVFNDKFLPFINCTASNQVFYGGAGSGKSVFLAQRDIISIVQEERNFLIIRKVQNTVRSSVFEEARKAIAQFHLTKFFDINYSDLSMIYAPVGNKMYFRGLDDVEKLKSITVPVGVLTDLRIEEATEITEQDYEQLDIRLRGLTHLKKRRTLSFNPIYKTHWISKRFFNCQNTKYYYSPKLLILHSNHLNNRFLAPEDHENIESKTGYFHDVYAKGEWGVLGDLIFTNWKVEDLSDMKDNFEHYRNGLDFGYTNDPSAFLRTSYKRNEKKIFVLDELYERGLMNPDIARMIKPIVKDRVVFCDSAEPKSVAELRQNNINARSVKKGKDSLLHGIQWLQQHEIIIHKDCKNTINEFGMYQWKKDKDGNNINEPVGTNDHTIAALRYAYETDFCETYFSWID